MKTLLRLLLVQIIFFLLGILALNIVLAFMDSTILWRGLGAPPGGAAQIVEADHMSVQVKTVSGELFYCRFRDEKECWIKNKKPEFRSSSENPMWLIPYAEPPTLSGVVDTQERYTQVSEYSTVLSVYAVKENGKVYVWQDGFGTPFDVFPAIIMVFPAAIGAGLVAWGLWEWGYLLFPRRKRKVE